jgi:D-amino-acid oxidase
VEVLVIGGGVSGLACGVRLAEAGFPTRLLARERPEKTVSAVAAALWHPFKAEPPEAIARWSRVSYEVYRSEAEDPATGVVMRPLLELFPAPTPTPLWADAVPDFRRVPPPPGYGDAFVGTVPVVSAPRYLRRLEARLAAAGAAVEEVPGGIASLGEVARPGRVVVVCAGLGAREVAGDAALYPIQGQVVRTTNPGVEGVLLDEFGPDGLVYVIPRADDVILGGTAAEGAWGLEPDPAVTERILRHARRRLPVLEAAEVLEVRVGLRPGRPAVRLEAERRPDGAAVVYNVGHGGSGYTLAWGCAADVLEHVRRLTGT